MSLCRVLLRVCFFFCIAKWIKAPNGAHQWCQLKGIKPAFLCKRTLRSLSLPLSFRMLSNLQLATATSASMKKCAMKTHSGPGRCARAPRGRKDSISTVRPPVFWSASTEHGTMMCAALSAARDPSSRVTITPPGPAAILPSTSWDGYRTHCHNSLDVSVEEGGGENEWWECLVGPPCTAEGF